MYKGSGCKLFLSTLKYDGEIRVKKSPIFDTSIEMECILFNYLTVNIKILILFLDQSWKLSVRRE